MRNHILLLILIPLLLGSCGGGGGDSILGGPDGGNGRLYLPPVTVPTRETFQNNGDWVASCLNTLPESTYQNASLCAWADQIFAYGNAARAENGVAQLTRSHGLDRIAQAHARDMALRNYFAHETPEGVWPWDRLLAANLKDLSFAVGEHSASDIAVDGVGENAAKGQESAKQVVDGWMQSTGHRKNLLNPIYTHVGTGVYYDPTDIDMPIHAVQLYVQDISVK